MSLREGGVEQAAVTVLDVSPIVEMNVWHREHPVQGQEAHIVTGILVAARLLEVKLFANFVLI